MEIEPIETTLERMEEIVAGVGWNRDSLLDLAKDFINEKGLTAAFVGYLEENAADEGFELKFKHLTNDQKDLIFNKAAEIMAAGNGGEDQMPLETAKHQVATMSISEMLETLPDNKRKVLPFDPETGEAWQD